MEEAQVNYGYEEGLKDTRREIERTARAMLWARMPNGEVEEELTERLMGAIAEHKYWLLAKYGIDESKANHGYCGQEGCLGDNECRLEQG